MNHSHSEHHDHADHHDSSLNGLAANATLHCLTGCAIGEIMGMIIGTAVGLTASWTVALAITLAFLFGYKLSTWPLLRAGLGIGAALRLVVAADTLSIATMELVDNAVMLLIPGAMDAGLVNTTFWIGMMMALTAAFVAAYPVNRWLLQKGQGHALVHEYHHHQTTVSGWRNFIPTITTGALVAVLIAFMAGGLIVSIAAQM